MAVPADLAAAEQEQDQKNGSRIESDHGQLHRRHTIGDVGHEEEDHLRAHPRHSRAK
jgi:hypothetical protein